MNLRLRKIWRDLWVNKTRTLLVILAIAVGVFALGMVFSTRIMLAEDLNGAYLARTPASAILYMDEFDEELVQSVRRMDHVLDAEGRRNISVRLQVAPDRWQKMRLEALQDYDDLRLNRIQSESGAWPPSEQTMLVERASLDFTNAQVGNTVQIKMPSGKERAVHIVGLAHDMNKVPAAFAGEGYGYITFDTLEWLGYSRQFNELHLLVDSQDEAQIKRLTEQVESKVEKSKRTVHWIWVPTPGTYPADEILQSLLMILGVLGALSLLLSAFLVINTTSAIISQQTRQIGIMKAIGASSAQIVLLYLATVLIFAFLALLIAVPLGALGAQLLTGFLAQLLNFDLMGFRIPPQTVLLQLVVGVVVPILAALWPVFGSTRVTVREALTDLGFSHRFGDSRIDQLLNQVRFLPASVLLSLRNTFRRQARLALTLFTLILAGAMFITVFTVRASLLMTLEEFTGYWNYDILVEFTEPYRTKQINHELRRVPGVTFDDDFDDDFDDNFANNDITNIENWGSTNANLVYPDGRKGHNFNLFAPPAESIMIQPLLVAGRWLLPDDQNAIVVDHDFLDKEPEVKLGDTITLKSHRRESEWQIIGIVKPRLSTSGLRFGAAYINYSEYAKMTRLVGRANSVRIMIRQQEPEAQLETIIALEKHFNRVGLHVFSIQSSDALRDTVKFQFNILVATLSVMAVMLTVVGGVGIMSTMSINVLERAREIGVMRAIGATNWAILRIFIVEGMLIGAMSWPLSVLLALPISKVLTSLIGIQLTHSPLTYTLPLSAIAFWLLLVLLLATAASFFPARNAARMTVREALAVG